MRRPRPVFFLPALLLLGLFLAPLPGMSGPVWRELQDAAHVAIFAALAAVLRHRLRSDAGTFLLAVAIGFGVEALQALGPRDASWSDVASDAAGAMVGLLALAAWQRRARTPRWRVMGLAAAAVLVAAVACWPLWRQAAAQLEARRAWPMLLDASLQAAPLNVVRRFATLDRTPRGLVVTFLRDPWPGVTAQGWMGNWSTRRAWMLDVENPTDQPLDLGLAVRDGQDSNEYDNRFNQSVPLAAHERRVVRLSLDDVARTPGGRHLDLADIRSYSLFRVSGGADRVVIHRVWLQ